MGNAYETTGPNFRFDTHRIPGCTVDRYNVESKHVILSLTHVDDVYIITYSLVERTQLMGLQTIDVMHCTTDTVGNGIYYTRATNRANIVCGYSSRHRSTAFYLTRGIYRTYMPHL